MSDLMLEMRSWPIGWKVKQREQGRIVAFCSLAIRAQRLTSPHYESVDAGPRKRCASSRCRWCLQALVIGGNWVRSGEHLEDFRQARWKLEFELIMQSMDFAYAICGKLGYCQGTPSRGPPSQRHLPQLENKTTFTSPMLIVHQHLVHVNSTTVKTVTDGAKKGTTLP